MSGAAPLTAQARAAEDQGRMLVRNGTDRSVCDAALIFARNRVLGEQAGRPDIARRGRSLSRRVGQQCASRIVGFWRRYGGCATPLAGRELETSVYWDPERSQAYQQYGLPRIAQVMDAGRQRWQAACPGDFAQSNARIAEARAAAPLPVPLAGAEAQPAQAAAPPAATVTATAEAPAAGALVEPSAAGYAEAPAPAPAAEAPAATNEAPSPPPAVVSAEAPAPATDEAPASEGSGDRLTLEVSAPPEVFERMSRANSLMSSGDFRGAMGQLQAAAAIQPLPAVLFNMGICLEHLGQYHRAAQVYERVTADPVLGERATQRVTVLRQMPARAGQPK